MKPFYVQLRNQRIAYGPFKTKREAVTFNATLAFAGTVMDAIKHDEWSRTENRFGDRPVTRECRLSLPPLPVCQEPII